MASPSTPMFNAPPWSLRLAGLLVGIHVLLYILPENISGEIYYRLAFNPQLLEAGAPYYWTLLTYALLHGGFLHVGINAAMLLALGSVVEREVGGRMFLVIFWLSTLGGAMAFWVFGDSWVVGASGGVSGLMGAGAVLLYRRRNIDPRARSIVTLVGVVLGINVLMAVLGAGGVAWQAHLGGLLAGMAYGYAVLDRSTPPGGGAPFRQI